MMSNYEDKFERGVWRKKEHSAGPPYVLKQETRLPCEDSYWSRVSQ